MWFFWHCVSYWDERTLFASLRWSLEIYRFYQQNRLMYHTLSLCIELWRTIVQKGPNKRTQFEFSDICLSFHFDQKKDQARTLAVENIEFHHDYSIKWRVNEKFFTGTVFLFLVEHQFQMRWYVIVVCVLVFIMFACRGANEYQKTKKSTQKPEKIKQNDIEQKQNQNLRTWSVWFLSWSFETYLPLVACSFWL